MYVKRLEAKLDLLNSIALLRPQIFDQILLGAKNLITKLNLPIIVLPNCSNAIFLGNTPQGLHLGTKN